MPPNQSNWLKKNFTRYTITGIINRSAAARLAIRRSIVVRIGVRARITWITIMLPIRSRITMAAATAVTIAVMVIPRSRSIAVNFGDKVTPVDYEMQEDKIRVLFLIFRPKAFVQIETMNQMSYSLFGNNKNLCQF